jgi:hypothetical protein
VRRLSSNALAFRMAPSDRWAVIRSNSPLEMHVVERLEQLPPMTRDLPERAAKAAPGAVH